MHQSGTLFIRLMPPDLLFRIFSGSAYTFRRSVQRLGYDLSAAQFKVLKLIYMQKSRTARVVDLEREFSMTHPTALGLLDQLEKKGFTTRIPNPEDGRGKLIALTAKADAMQAELEALGNAVEEKLTEHLSDDEKGKLILLLCKLLNLSDQEV